MQISSIQKFKSYKLLTISVYAICASSTLYAAEEIKDSSVLITPKRETSVSLSTSSDDDRFLCMRRDSSSSESSGEEVDKNFLEIAEEYANKAEWPDAIKYYKKAARRQSVEAQYVLSQIYKVGKPADENNPNSCSVDKDGVQYLRYLQKAALNLEGHAQAKFEWAQICETDTSSLKDLTEAKKFYKQAADLEHPKAQLRMAQLLLKTLQGVSVDEKVHQDKIMEITKYINQSVSKDDPEAMCVLASFYERGYIMRQNLTEAFILYQKAAHKGSDLGLYKIGRFYELEVHIDNEQNPRKKAVECYQRVRASGNVVKVYRRLADMLLDDKPAQASMDYMQAIINLYKEGADNGDVQSLVELANLHYEGSAPLQKDNNIALRYYHEAADKGSIEASAFLGKLYLEGKDVSKDLEKAFSSFLKAFDYDIDSQFELAKLYKNGLGVAQNHKEAMKHFFAVAQKDPTHPYVHLELKEYVQDKRLDKTIEFKIEEKERITRDKVKPILKSIQETHSFYQSELKKLENLKDGGILFAERYKTISQFLKEAIEAIAELQKVGFMVESLGYNTSNSSLVPSSENKTILFPTITGERSYLSINLEGNNTYLLRLWADILQPKGFENTVVSAFLEVCNELKIIIDGSHNDYMKALKNLYDELMYKTQTKDDAYDKRQEIQIEYLKKMIKKENTHLQHLYSLRLLPKKLQQVFADTQVIRDLEVFEKYPPLKRLSEEPSAAQSELAAQPEAAAQAEAAEKSAAPQPAAK